MGTIAIRVEETGLWRKLFEFRYRIYVEEQGFVPPTADHANRILTDPLDEVSASFALLRDGEVIGSLRLTPLDAIPDPAPFIRRLSMQAAINAFGRCALGLSSRFIFDANKPSPRGMFRLMEMGYFYGKERGCRLTFGDCSPALLDFYRHMGYRDYTEPFIDPVYGEKIPIFLILGDRDRLTQLRSPLARCAASYPTDVEAVEWFESTYPSASELRVDSLPAGTQ
jgi:hypothetical protein